jgi:uroporphyrinogen decarboxylase
MKPRERVRLALNHKEPDKVPIDLGATNISSMVTDAYQNLRRHLGMKPDPDPEISHSRQGTVYPMPDLFEHYQVDFRPVTMKRAPRWVATKTLPNGDWYDEFNIRWKKSLYYYDAINYPLADCTVEDLDKYVWPDPYDPERVKGLREHARNLYENTDYAIVADIICRGPFEHACRLRGFEQFCLDLALDARFAKALLDKATEFIIGLWDAYLGAVGDCAQVVCQGEDLGMQNSLIISPETYRKLIKPRHQQIFGFIHSKTEAKVFLHSDGSIYDIIPDFIEVGVDILNPVQYSAANMDLPRLKKEFGQDLCFWGAGIDVQQVLYNASLEEIEQEVRRNIEIMAPGGGYVFAPTHNIQPDVSPDRLDKVYETALKYQQYPIAVEGEYLG